MGHASTRVIAATAAGMLLLAACGQKPGVFVDDPLAGGEFVAVDDGTGTEEFVPAPDAGDEVVADDPGEVPDDTGTEALDAPTDGSPAAPTASSGGQQQSGTTTQRGGGGNGGNGGQAGTSSSGPQQPRGSDRRGVTDSTITVAIHAPITGAAPLPSTSFEEAREAYWKNLEAQGVELPGGRDVRVIFRDDRFAPDVARQVCRELADEALFLVGGGGSDGIQACGQLAGQLRVPYLSPGTTEAGLDDNPWYFAASMSYKQQGDLLAQLVKKEFGDARTAAVFHNTPNVNDGLEGWEAGVQRQGVNYFRTFRSERSSNPNFGPIIQQLQADGVEVVHVLMSPLNYIQFAQTARSQGLDLQYVGYGITKGLNAVLNSGCPDVDGGIFFSPFPALETADRIDPEFRRASQRTGAPADDIAWAIWGLNKSLHELLKDYEAQFGDDITREDLRALIERSNVESGIFPEVRYSPQDHFGGTSVHVLRADCASGQYRDAGTFKTSF